jgi:hypothetical protein
MIELRKIRQESWFDSASLYSQFKKDKIMTVDIFLNPSTKEMKSDLDNWARAIILINGDMYAFSADIIHNEIVDLFNNKGIVNWSNPNSWYHDKSSVDQFICVEISYGSVYEVSLAASYFKLFYIEEDIQEVVNKYYKNFKKKNPRFELVT